MRTPVFTGCVLVLFSILSAVPAAPAAPRAARPSPSPTVSADRRIAAAALYSRRSRRLVQSYLRLKILEMRQGDLERVRQVIERKVGIGALLGETPRPYIR